MSYSTEHHTPFELTDCERIELGIAAKRARRFKLDPALDSHRRNIDHMIAEYGYAIYAVGTGECDVPGCDGGHDESPWSYTVGRSFFGAAELVTTGLDGGAAEHLTNLIGQLPPFGWRAGGVIRVSDRTLRLDAVPPDWLFADAQRMSWWIHAFAPFHRRAGDAPSVVQIVYPDSAGRFPDEPECDSGLVAVQPVLAADPVAYPPIDIDSEWDARPSA